jgi:hypothetical protein
MRHAVYRRHAHGNVTMESEAGTVITAEGDSAAIGAAFD